MLRVFAFGDLSWLEYAQEDVREAIRRPNFRINFAALPQVITDILAGQINQPLVLVGSKYYCSYPYPVRSSDYAWANRINQKHLRIKAAGNDVHRFARDYHKGGPEKCVDTAMAVGMVELAAKQVFDIALVMTGDLDFKPAMESVKRFGKLVALATTCKANAELVAPTDPDNIRNYLIYFEHHADAIGGECLEGC